MSVHPTEKSNKEDFYKTLLESTQAIPWKLEWPSMQFSYIGPQIERLLGWPQSSWVSAEDWAARIHPEDRDRVVSFCIAQSQSGMDHEADYKALTNDGHYVWIRDVVHVVRNPQGEVESLIGFMFDISERKQNEEMLSRLQKELEALSFKDGLTDIANRRMFDSRLQIEWHHAMQTHQPLSLLLLDIDFFKQYNDFYGHLQGDECLKQVSKLLSHSILRARDFIARFGGEEFVMILPETDAQNATRVAERCRQAIVNARIPHERSTIQSVVTVSIGVGTFTPSSGDTPHAFIEQVDKRLYHVKQNGRNGIRFEDD